MMHIDLLIIGAGPAGLSTALHLLQSNPAWETHMLAIEKEVHPREKLCAGGLTPLGINLLKQLNFPYPLPLPQVPIHSADFAYGAHHFQVKGRPRFIVFDRMAFDHYLAQTARERGLRIHEGETVLNLQFSPDGVTVTTTQGVYRAKAVVGADGSTGITRRAIKQHSAGKRATRQRVARLLEVRIPAKNQSTLFSEKQAIFDFSPGRQDLQGYIWQFPSQAGGERLFNCGIYDARIATSRPKAGLPAALKTALAGDALQSDKNIAFKGHPLHRFSPANSFSVPRLLAVGDAAGADPLFGEGIGPALKYGQIAAQEIENAFARNDFSFRRYQRRVLFSQLGWYLWWRWAAAQAVYRLSGHPRFMRALWVLARAISQAYNAVFARAPLK
jgi:flavin-dependent dehydrogenase